MSNSQKSIFSEDNQNGAYLSDNFQLPLIRKMQNDKFNCSPNDSGFDTDGFSPQNSQNYQNIQNSQNSLQISSQSSCQNSALTEKRETLAKLIKAAGYSKSVLANIDLNQPIVKEVISDLLSTFKKKSHRKKPKPAVLQIIDRKTASKLTLTQKLYSDLLELQRKRDIGMYVICDSCDKMRYLPRVKDPLDLPDKWYCADINISCTLHEMELSETDINDLINNKYSPGSIVLVKFDGFPWWPAIVNDDPEVMAYYQLADDDKFNPIKYFVTFFNKTVKSAWVEPHFIVPFMKNKDLAPYCINQNKKYRSKNNLLKKAFQQAESACAMQPSVRLLKYSMISRSTIIIVEEEN